MQIFGNFVRGTLKTAINSSVVTLDFTPDSGWEDPPLLPEAGQWSKYVLTDHLSAPTKHETVWARTSTDNTSYWTFGELIRGAEGSTAQSWSVGDPIVMTLTAADAQSIAPANELVNPHLQIWQDLTSRTTTGELADFWSVYKPGAWAGTAARYVIGPNSGIPGHPPYAIKVTPSTAADGFVVRQRMADCRRFAGQTITVGVWAFAGGAANLKMRLQRNYGSGGSTADTIYNPAVTTMTINGWFHYVWTVDVPDIYGKTIGADSYIVLDFILYSPNTSPRYLTAFSLAVGRVPAPSILKDAAEVLLECQSRWCGGHSDFRTWQSSPSSTKNTFWVTQWFPRRMRAGPTLSVTVSTQTGGLVKTTGINNDKFEIYLDSNNSTSEVKKMTLNWTADARL